MPRTALVVDAGGTTAVEVVRSLAAAGWSVDLLHRRGSPAARSRYVRAAHLLRPTGPALVASVQTVLRTSPADLLFATGDADLLVLSQARGELPVRVPWPAHEVVLLAHDKHRLAAAAAAAGVRVPRELPLAEALAADGATRWAVKPRRHEEQAETLPTVLVEGEAELRAAVLRLERGGVEPIVQEALTGDLVAYVVVLSEDGSLLAEVQQVAERVYPLGAGNCVRGRTTAVERHVAEAALRMLRGIGWYGIAQLEYVQPPGEAPALVDLNGRFYGSMALARRAGLNLPALEAQRASGTAGATSAARVGARYSATALDLRAAVSARAPADVGRALLAGVGAAHPVWDAVDPLPMSATAGAAARAVAVRLRRSA